MEHIWELKKWIPDPCNPHLHNLKPEPEEEKEVDESETLSTWGTKNAGAIGLGEVTYADNLAVAGVETGLDSVQEVRLAVLKVSAQGKGAKVGQLDHTGQGRINEQRGLNDVTNLGPEGALPVEGLHQGGQL